MMERLHPIRADCRHFQRAGLGTPCGSILILCKRRKGLIVEIGMILKIMSMSIGWLVVLLKGVYKNLWRRAGIVAQDPSFSLTDIVDSWRLKNLSNAMVLKLVLYWLQRPIPPKILMKGL